MTIYTFIYSVNDGASKFLDPFGFHFLLVLQNEVKIYFFMLIDFLIADKEIRLNIS